MEFGRGLCPTRNIKGVLTKEGKLKYNWLHSDQPGIWYSLYKTHMEFFNPDLLAETKFCNNETGYISLERGFGPELNKYMGDVAKAKIGSDGVHFTNFPDDQPILWSTPSGNGGMPIGGLGLQMTYGIDPNDPRQKGSFALHKKNNLPEDIILELEQCKRRYGCHANFSRGELMFSYGCGSR
jgi:hypothetical protein